jgi:hypothetical protein
MTHRLPKLAVASLALLACLLLQAAWAAQARAAYGDDYGIAEVNAPPATPLVPALPGETHAFWAGTCDRAAFTALDTPIPGGIGSRPSSLLVPAGFGQVNPRYTSVPAPPMPDHCVDWGAQSLYTKQAEIWQTIPFDEPPYAQATPVGEYVPRWRLAPVTQAGARPDGTTIFAWKRNASGEGTDAGRVDGQVDDIVVDLPPGFVGNPNAVPKCTDEQFAVKPLACPPQTQIGVLRLNIEAKASGNLVSNHDTTYPVYNLEPRQGNVAEVGFGYASSEGAVTVRLVGKARTNGDFGVTAFTGQIPAALTPIAQSITIWGVPWSSDNDLWRAPAGHEPADPCSIGPSGSTPEYIPPDGMPGGSCRAPYDPSWGATPEQRAIKPFLTTETDCNPAPAVRLATDSFQRPGPVTGEGDPDIPPFPQLAPPASTWKTYLSQSPAVTGCEDLPFAPDIELTPTTQAADGASGLSVDFAIPQNNDPKGPGGEPLAPPAPGASQGAIDAYVQAAEDYWRSSGGLATAHLKDSVVTLPLGMSVNPSGATGLRACSDAQIGVRQQGDPPLFDNQDPFDGQGAECPQESVIGTVEVSTPLLDEPLTGRMVLGEPKSTDPQSGEMFRLFFVVRSVDRGLIAKIYGSTKADPQTGQLVTTFQNNPEVPFEDLTLELKGGSKGLIGMPQRCGAPTWTSTFAPWSSVGAPVAVPAVPDGGAFAVDSNCGFGFAPGMRAGTSDRRAKATTSFTFELTRRDGEQWLRGLTTELPQGLLASVRGFPLCADAQAAAGACPAASRIGSVDGTSGSGDPFVLERKGDLYLTEGYEGGAYGLMARVPVEAGPFRGDRALSPIVVRQAIHVDPTTAQVRAVSDPFPLIHHGIPLRVRKVVATIDRPGFVLNPTDCSAKQVTAGVVSAEGATADVAHRFQASGCAALPFRPRLAMRLTGRRQTRTGGHPGVRSVVTQRRGEAGIDRAQVRLPLSLALDPDNAQALCEFEDGTKADLERHCPRGSIVGRARAVSPLLNDPLVGNVYFVKNVRTDPKTGNQIRTLPMIVAALRGEIAVNLRGESSVSRRNQLVSTFATVPDAPVDRFNLNVVGGRNGILVVTRSRRGRRISVCRGRQVAEADFDGQNGKRYDRNVRMRTPCKKQQKRSKSRRAARRRD